MTLSQFSAHPLITSLKLLRILTLCKGALSCVHVVKGVGECRPLCPGVDRAGGAVRGCGRRLAGQTYEGGEYDEYTFTTSGLLKTVTTPNGRTTSYGYDTDGNLRSVTAPKG